AAMAQCRLIAAVANRQHPVTRYAILMSDRPPIPTKLADQVMFACDRTCCVCKLKKRMQIHHLDQDPTNNTFENLVALCLECHDQSHMGSSLTRGLTVGAIRLFNDAWRQVVQLKLLPHESARKLAEYQAEVLLDIALSCENWADIAAFETCTDSTSALILPLAAKVSRLVWL